MLIQITSKHFCAGVLLHVEAAPIIGYMRRWTLREIVVYCERKGWNCQVIQTR